MKGVAKVGYIMSSPLALRKRSVKLGSAMLDLYKAQRNLNTKGEKVGLVGKNYNILSVSTSRYGFIAFELFTYPQD